MKKLNLLKWGFLSLFCMLGTFAWASDSSEIDTLEVTLPNTDEVYCTFNDKKISNSTYFDISASCGNDTKYGRVEIGDVTYTAYCKFTKNDSITITTTEANTELTIVFGPADISTTTTSLTITINGTEETVSENVYTYKCESVGEYVIKTGSDRHIFYIGASKALAEVAAKTYEHVTINLDDIVCWFDDGTPTNQDYFTFTSCSYGTNGDNGCVVINEDSIKNCLKLESDTEVSFTTSVTGATLTLVFGETETTPDVKIDGTKQTGTSNVMTFTLDEAGKHTITKADTHYIFYMGVSGDVVETDEITWSNVIVDAVTDETGDLSTSELTTDDNTIKVTFTDKDSGDATDVTVITDDSEDYYSYITVGSNEKKYPISASNEGETDAASTWLLTIPDEAMAVIKDSVDVLEVASATVVIVAQDADGGYVRTYSQETFPTSTCNFSAPSEETESPYYFYIDPSDSDPVESLSEFTVTIDEGDDAYFTIAEDADLSDIKVYSADDATNENALASVASSDVTDNSNLTSVTFKLDTEITDAGTYKVIIPEGFFLCGGSATNPSTEKTGYIVVEQSVTYSLTVTTQDNSTTVDSIAAIIITEDNKQTLELVGDEEYVVVYDKDGNEITTGVYGAIDYNNPEEDENTLMEDDVVYGYIVPLNDTITTAGTYTIVISKEFVGYGEASSEGYNDEITIEVTVSGVATGIKGVTLQATGDDKFYNLNGQRVTSPRNGVYILNGKKILIK